MQGQSIENAHQAITTQPAPNLNGQGLTGKQIKNCQNPEPATVSRSGSHKIHRPGLIRCAWSLMHVATNGTRHMRSRSISLDLQPLEAVETVHTFDIDVDTSALQHDVNPLKPEAQPCLCNIADFSAQRILRWATTLVAVYCPTDADHAAGPTFADVISTYQITRRLTSMGDAHHFFPAMS